MKIGQWFFSPDFLSLKFKYRHKRDGNESFSRAPEREKGVCWAEYIKAVRFSFFLLMSGAFAKDIHETPAHIKMVSWLHDETETA